MEARLTSPKPKLTDRQRLFIEKYCRCFNATQAAREAGYSARSARQIGQATLSNPVIRAEIERQFATHAMAKNEVLARLASHARGDMSNFVKVVGRKVVLDLEGAAARGDMRLVKRIKFDAQGAVTIELYDAQRALVTLAQVYKLIGKGGGNDDGWDDDEADETEQIERPVGDEEILVEAMLAG